MLNLSRSIVAWISVSFLLVPLVVLYYIQNMSSRFVVIFVATAAFILTLSFFGKAKAAELLLASAWWATLLLLLRTYS